MDIVNRFITYLFVEKQYSKLTVRAYRDDICQFLSYMGISVEVNGFDAPFNNTLIVESFNIAEVKTNDLRGFVMHLSQLQLKHSSINRKISSVKALFRYAVRLGVIAVDPSQKIQQLRREKRVAVFMPESTMESCLDEIFQPDTDNGENYIREREDLIILMFYGTGIRLAELINLEIKNIDFDRREIKVLGKGNKERILPINDVLIEKIKNYLKIRSNILQIENNLLFLSLTNRHISRSEVYRIINRRLAELGVSGKRSPHTLRHTYATHLLNGGAGIETLRELLGHSSLAATQVYTHNNIGILLDRYKKAHPRAKKK